MVLPNAPEEYLLASSWEVSRRTQPRWAISDPNPVRAKDALVLSMEQMMWATGVRRRETQAVQGADRPQRRPNGALFRR